MILHCYLNRDVYDHTQGGCLCGAITTIDEDEEDSVLVYSHKPLALAEDAETGVSVHIFSEDDEGHSLYDCPCDPCVRFIPEVGRSHSHHDGVELCEGGCVESRIDF